MLLFCLPSEVGKPVHLKESEVTLTKGKIIQMARDLLANGIFYHWFLEQ
jgi:hypothetical protein